jgi:hypothetical protein
VNQSFTCDKLFLHVMLPLYKSKLLVKRDTMLLWIILPITWCLWQDWKQSLKVSCDDLKTLCKPNPNWSSQEWIDDTRVALRVALLLHYNFDLAAVQRFLGGQHVSEHWDPDKILPQVEGLIPDKVYDDLLECIMRFGAPAHYNEHGKLWAIPRIQGQWKPQVHPARASSIPQGHEQRR